MEKTRTYKAVLYSRVSTTHDEQAESIDNQVLLAKNYLARHPEIEMAEPFDRYSERISGKTDIRPRFQELCERLTHGDIDYLMIKDLKRLARSVETTYAFLNIMKQNGFKIIRLDTGKIIDSKGLEEEESNLLIGIEALFAQNTVLTQSRYGKTVQRIRCENKLLVRKDSTLFGYKWDPEIKDIAVDEEKAVIIRELFNQYVFLDKGIIDLREYLLSIGYNYSIVSISKWLQETKYIGDWTINRTSSILGIGQGAKTRRYRRKSSEWIHVKRPDLAIVDKELFDLAQDIRLSRVKTYVGEGGKEKTLGNFRGTHLFAGKIFCAECNSGYRHRWADRLKSIGIYCDTYRQKSSGLECPNIRFRRIYEEDVKDIVVNAIKALNIKGSISIVKMMESISFGIRSTQGNEIDVEAETKRIKKLEKDADRISSAFIDAAPALRSRLNDQYETIAKELDECKRRLRRKANVTVDEELVRNRLSSIEERLSSWINVNKQNLDRKAVDDLVSKIIIHKDGRIEVCFTLGGFEAYRFSDESYAKPTKKPPRGLTLPSKETISENVKNTYKDVLGESIDDVNINMFSFSQKTHGDENTQIDVTINTKK